MNFARTALLLAAMTALFLAVGYLIAGESGALIAFFIALAHERLGILELGQDGAAHAPGAAGDPGLGAGAGRHGRAAGAQRRAADARRVPVGDRPAERVRDRPQSRRTARSR